MKNMSTTMISNNSNNLTSLSSPAHMDFLSRCHGELGHNCFLRTREGAPKAEKLVLVINMAFADVMLGAVSVPLFVYLKVGFQLWSITHEVGVVLHFFYLHFDIIFLQASLISAVFISCERFYAVYRPLKHRTLSTKAYAIVISVIWTLAIVASVMYLILAKYAFKIP